MRRPRRRTVGVVLMLAVAVLVGAAAWWVQPQPLLPEAEASLASTPAVAFARVDGRLEWAPASGDYATGLVVYPGGKVRPEAYGPLAHEIAAAGFLVVVVPVPLNLAVFGIDAATPAIAAHPSVTAWAVGGHSLGGSMAAQYAEGRTDTIRGLALWASWAATDLSDSGIRALSIYGTLDRSAARMSGEEARANLPPDAEFVAIEGGNHEQMGWYTGQPNDPPGMIGRADQQRRVAEATIELLRRIAGS
jgi:pimeloyl-ACP methyl ester carboxylesterase